MASLNTFLESEVGQFEPEVQEMARYTFAHSGKRLRPILVFFSGWGGKGDSAEVVKAAAIVEMVHLATLVHDDILDSATLRHGAPTLVAKYGAHQAVLLGDALFSEALRLAAQFPTTEICRIVATATRRVCEGEIGQTFARGNDRLTRAAYYRVIELKTAELFRASCRLGDAADDYGMHLGTAYQIFDDVADILGDEKSIGKTLGTDLASGKFTLPLLLLLEKSPEAERAKIAAGLAKRDGAELRRMLVEAGVVEAVRAAFDAEVDAALAALKPFAANASCEPLDSLATFVRGLMERY
jgi:octaprenyl-diphosphate synthase